MFRAAERPPGHFSAGEKSCFFRGRGSKTIPQKPARLSGARQTNCVHNPLFIKAPSKKLIARGQTQRTEKRRGKRGTSNRFANEKIHTAGHKNKRRTRRENTRAEQIFLLRRGDRKIISPRRPRRINAGRIFSKFSGSKGHKKQSAKTAPRTEKTV